MVGCGLIAVGPTAALNWRLALFLTGSGLNVACINMALAQRFTPEDSRREGVFLWNYAGMTQGFSIGLLLPAIANSPRITRACFR